jgi:hypothetical protein
MQFEEKPHSANAATVPSSEIASSSGRSKRRLARHQNPEIENFSG